VKDSITSWLKNFKHCYSVWYSWNLVLY
jgi:hypothetical protein